jgi:hypothetical protein
MASTWSLIGEGVSLQKEKMMMDNNGIVLSAKNYTKPERKLKYQLLHSILKLVGLVFTVSNFLK